MSPNCWELWRAAVRSVRGAALRWAVVTIRNYEMLQGRATSLQFNCLTNWQRSVEVCELFRFLVLMFPQIC